MVRGEEEEEEAEEEENLMDVEEIAEAFQNRERSVGGDGDSAKQGLEWDWVQLPWLVIYTSTYK